MTPIRLVLAALIACHAIVQSSAFAPVSISPSGIAPPLNSAPVSPGARRLSVLSTTYPPFRNTFSGRRRPTSSPILPTALSATGGLGEESSAERTGPRVCVIGGGFGGLNAALTLANLPWSMSDGCPKPTITLVDDKERFVFLPLLYELCVDAASVEEVAPTYRSLLEGTGVRFERRDVTGVDVENRVVYTIEPTSSSPCTMTYDALVIATGAQMNLDAIPGARDFALPFYTVDHCYELRRRFNVLDSRQPITSTRDKKGDEEKVEVVIVGGGYSGVELALNTLERLGGAEQCSVTLVHRGDEALQYATDYNRKTGQDRLEKAGIRVLTGTTVCEIIPTSSAKADLEDDSSGGLEGSSFRTCLVKVIDRKGHRSDLRTDLLLWTAGATSANAPIGVLNSLLPRDSDGRIVTGPYLRAKGLDNIFALGDCSRARKVPYAATAQVAMQQAPVVAWNIFAYLNNNYNRRGGDKSLKLLPFSYLDLGEMMTLGNDDATISSLGGLVQLSGPGASVLRRLIYAVRMPTARQGLTAAVEGAQRRLQLSRIGEVDSMQGRKGEKRGGKPIQWK
eukprot:CAMPEP_0113583042 /NCGR_PEP_ID=MMETSP0015_2-20120614/32272_1 /TAXON_ID=2838 /ORGANISM="Odontella" /LENGTH=565 /DNA_ID=CAMNT_0000487825 /DNA_START=203 /DNA_END=1900 /DNA_ORIENTATION=+ /assembly_acc=CAM_ASM_000160